MCRQSRYLRTTRQGTWETPGFQNAERKIEIVVEDLGSGDVEVR